MVNKKRLITFHYYPFLKLTFLSVILTIQINLKNNVMNFFNYPTFTAKRKVSTFRPALTVNQIIYTLPNKV